ncbi:hypothetical protein Gogos_020011 [Gossypium gossypioides]|uniref:Uncharacterized protein n=1 Tax=Gossypium gossypioides TaxID=34282 RepID=A0A7J9D4S4_GOSGO|nr:hypothetical protein [Gossypium gossypioides]
MVIDLELSLNMSSKDKLLVVGLIASGKEHMVSGDGSDRDLVLWDSGNRFFKPNQVDSL